jgi:DNA topoisomerase VI subunit B
MRALVELIWNAIDAEASTIGIALARTNSDAIEKVVVTDDGHGISRDEIVSTFGRIGDSWKLFATKSKNGKRGLHGKQGAGHLRAFALGTMYIELRA